MMIDRMFNGDIQEEILNMQIDISNSMANPNPFNKAITTHNVSRREHDQVNFVPKEEVKPTPQQLYSHQQQHHHQQQQQHQRLIQQQQPNQPLNQNQQTSKVEPSLTSEIKPLPGLDVLIPKSVESISSQRNNKNVNIVPPIKTEQKSDKFCIQESYNNVISPKMNSNVKKEVDHFDIESEITPNIILRKCEPTYRVSPINSDFNIDYVCNTSGSSQTINNPVKKREEDVPKEPYDEWSCIQKELSLMAEKRAEQNRINDIYNQPSLKVNVDNHLNDLFIGRTDNLKLNVVAQNSPLSELFSTGDTVNHHSHMNHNKSVEHRLDAMFGDDSDLEKSDDLVETRLDALFHGSPISSEHHHSHHHQQHNLLSNSDYVMHHNQQHLQHNIHSNSIHANNKRQWNNNGEMLSPSSPPLFSSKRSCMVSTFVEEHGNRWMMDCQQQPFDFIPNSNHDINKRLWNGDGMSNSIDHIPNKKMCFNNVNKGHDIDRELLSLSSSPQPLDNTALMNLHQLHNENAFDSLTSSAMGGGSSSTANTSNNSITSNFDDDINRHVQNAIDSILNLQNSETDSLHFSLDQTMNSFLADSPLSTSGMTTTSQHRTQSAVRQRRNNRLDDISDCLISGVGAGGDMMMDSPPLPSSSGNNDFNMASGIDEAIKSIITS